MAERIQAFEQGGRQYVLFDLSHIKHNADFMAVTEDFKRYVRQQGAHSVYALADVKDVLYDSQTKQIMVNLLAHNEPYVRAAAVFGLDGIKQMMVKSILKASRRNNIKLCRSREQAMDWLAGI